MKKSLFMAFALLGISGNVMAACGTARLICMKGNDLLFDRSFDEVSKGPLECAQVPNAAGQTYHGSKGECVEAQGILTLDTGGYTGGSETLQTLGSAAKTLGKGLVGGLYSASTGLASGAQAAGNLAKEGLGNAAERVSGIVKSWFGLNKSLN